MNETFQKRLYEVFIQPRADQYVQAYHLVEHYNANRLDDNIIDLIHLPQFDEMESVGGIITNLFNDAMYDILVSLLVVPKRKQFDELLYLLNGVWLIEHSFDSGAIVDIIDAMDYPVDPADALASLLEYVDRADWIEVRGYLHTVTQTFIRKVYNYHTEQLEIDVDEGAENVMERKTELLKTYFTNHPSSITYHLIHRGQLPIPTEEMKVMSIMKPLIYNLESDEAIAVELVAMSLILPITPKSTAKQAKIFADKLFPDPMKVIALNNHIDKFIKTLGDLS